MDPALRAVHARADATRRQRARPRSPTAGRQQLVVRARLRRHRLAVLRRHRRSLGRGRHLSGVRGGQQLQLRTAGAAGPVDAVESGLARERVRDRFERQPRWPLRAALAVGTDRRDEPGLARLSRSARLPAAQTAGDRTGRRDRVGDDRGPAGLRRDDRHLDVDAACERARCADARGRPLPRRRLSRRRRHHHADRAPDRLRERRHALAGPRQRAELRDRLGRDRCRRRGGCGGRRMWSERLRLGHRARRRRCADRGRAHRVPARGRRRRRDIGSGRALRAPRARDGRRARNSRVRLRLSGVCRERRAGDAGPDHAARRGACTRADAQARWGRARRADRLAAACAHHGRRLAARAAVDRSAERCMVGAVARRRAVPARRRARHRRLPRDLARTRRVRRRAQRGDHARGRRGRLQCARLRARGYRVRAGLRSRRASARLEPLEPRPRLAVRRQRRAVESEFRDPRAWRLCGRQRRTRRGRRLGQRRPLRPAGDAADRSFAARPPRIDLPQLPHAGVAALGRPRSRACRGQRRWRCDLVAPRCAVGHDVRRGLDHAGGRPLGGGRSFGVDPFPRRRLRRRRLGCARRGMGDRRRRDPHRVQCTRGWRAGGRPGPRREHRPVARWCARAHRRGRECGHAYERRPGRRRGLLRAARAARRVGRDGDAACAAAGRLRRCASDGQRRDLDAAT